MTRLSALPANNICCTVSVLKMYKGESYSISYSQLLEAVWSLLGKDESTFSRTKVNLRLLDISATVSNVFS